MTQQLPPTPQRPYATDDVQAQTKPVFQPGDDPLPFTRDVRYAAIDVMILTFGALRRAQWLEKIGLCPPDVAEQIERHVEMITRIVRRVDAPTNPAPHVGPRPQPPERGDNPTPSLYDATRANTVAHTRPNGGCQSGRQDW